MIFNLESLLNVELMILLKDVMLGLVIGLAIGMTGVGGGVLIQPSLIHIIGLSPVVSVGSGLAFAVITKMGGLLTHLKLKTVNASLAFYCLLGSIPGILISSKMISYLVLNYDVNRINAYIQISMAIILLVVSLIIIIQVIYTKAKFQISYATNGNDINLNLRQKLINSCAGFLIGILIGATSIGGGVVIISFLIVLLNVSTRTAIGTSIAISLVISAFGTVVYVYGGFVDFSTTIFLSIGSIPGVYLGSILAAKTPEWFLKMLLIIITVLSGISLFFGIPDF